MDMGKRCNVVQEGKPCNYLAEDGSCLLPKTELKEKCKALEKVEFEVRDKWMTCQKKR